MTGDTFSVVITTNAFTVSFIIAFCLAAYVTFKMWRK